jgi:RNA polymerase sigma-70 factor (ECF subfamily)
MPTSRAEPTDLDLVARLEAGDERALGALYDRYAERLYSLACAILSDPGDAEEAVADTFLQLWRARDYEAARGAVGAYLTVVLRSRAVDRLRARRRRGAAEGRAAAVGEEGLALPLGAVGAPPDRAVEMVEDRARVEGALADLPEKQRTVIGLAYFEGLTHTEIAERLAEPLGTVKTRLRDGMRRLRDAMAPRSWNAS